MAIGAFLDLAESRSAEISVPVVAYAEPSGRVLDTAFERIAERICSAVASGCDAVLLDLHGAMVTESWDDGEGELLRRIRAVDADVPIGVALDFHTNLTRNMVENATVITGYRTYPHVDMYETGRRAGQVLLRALKGEVEPRIVWGALPIITHLIRQTPARQPMKDVMDLAIAAEERGRGCSRSDKSCNCCCRGGESISSPRNHKGKCQVRLRRARNLPRTQTKVWRGRGPEEYC